MGMRGRPRRSGKMVRLNIFLEPETLRQIQALGELRDLTDGGVARELIVERLSDVSERLPQAQRERVPA